MTEFTDYYQLLGLQPTATVDDIQTSYAILKKDLRGDKTPIAKAKLKLLEEAIDILLNEETKSIYDEKYAENVEKAKTAAAPKYKDFSKFRSASLDPWYEIFSPSQSVGSLLKEAIGQLVSLPDSDFQTPVLAAYLAIPTGLTSTIPILFCQGVSGSGKTQILELAKIVWNLELILTAKTTGVALRNDIKACKYEDPDNLAYEKLIHGIVFDDLSQTEFSEKPYLYGLLKAGYKRAADTIKIADKEGKNFTFRVYGGRAFSSITPFDSIPEYSELHRRLLTIKTALDKKVIVLNPDSINWNGFYKKIYDFWNDENRCNEFASKYKAIERKIAKGVLDMHSHHASISGALIVAGGMSGVWESEEMAIDNVRDYWKIITEKRTYMQSSTIREIKEFLEAQKREAGLRGRKFMFTGKMLNEHLDRLKKDGHLDTLITVPQLADIMKGFGFRLINGIWEKAE